MTRSHHPRSTDGQSLVEFALAFPIFLLLLFGLIDIGRFVYTANAVSQAAREGARYGSVGDWSASCGGSRQSCVVQETIDRLAGVTVKPSDVKVTCWRHLMSDPSKPVSSVPMSDCGANDVLKVELKSQFQVLTPMIGQILGPTDISGASSVTVNQ
ncbi:MAG TPA: TadE/TadG family type IV pilus assembly protein [Patescibacteria group bacterium]|nr:TadE/TadG family type IV pilus assembly protein [Patescibacteria group bacterium]